MKKLTNIHVVSRRQQQRPVMKFLKPVPFVVVLGIGLTLMGCGDGSDDVDGSRTEYWHRLRGADRVPGCWAGHRFDSEHNRAVQDRLERKQQRQRWPTTPMVVARLTGTVEASRYDNSAGHAVQYVPEHTWCSVHHDRGQAFRKPRLQEGRRVVWRRSSTTPDLRHHLQHLQP